MLCYDAYFFLIYCAFCKFDYILARIVRSYESFWSTKACRSSCTTNIFIYPSSLLCTNTNVCSIMILLFFYCQNVLPKLPAKLVMAHLQQEFQKFLSRLATARSPYYIRLISSSNSPAETCFSSPSILASIKSSSLNSCPKMVIVSVGS